MTRQSVKSKRVGARKPKEGWCDCGAFATHLGILASLSSSGHYQYAFYCAQHAKEIITSPDRPRFLEVLPAGKAPKPNFTQQHWEMPA